MEPKKLKKNKVYLYLLIAYNGKHMPKYTELGKKIGCTRQTVASKISELISNDIVSIDEFNTIFVKNVLELNLNKIKEELGIIIEDNDNEEEKIIDYNKDVKETFNQESIIYGIVVDGELKYVGSTDRYEDRMFEHMRKRKFLTEKNFVILNKENNKGRFNIERQLIHLLKPEWNIAGLSFN